MRRAALLQDIGRLGVSNAIWDKPGPLSRPSSNACGCIRTSSSGCSRGRRSWPSWARSPRCTTNAATASGTRAGFRGSSLPAAAKLLAAADCYQALIEPRPHRPARSPAEAEAELRLEVRAGRLDGEAVNAVLAAAGHRVRRRREWPAGLTPREVEVLRLLSRGASNKEIARELVISPKTAGNHVEHIYLKTGARTRAGASLFAMKHGLLDAEMGQTPHETVTTRA